MKVKNLIIGCGMSGIITANKLAQDGQDSLIIEKRGHIGGNCYDYYDENGILVHAYGPHIFHTNHEDVRAYLNKFTNFTNYFSKVLGMIDGNLAPIPFNMNTMYKVFSPELAEDTEKALLKHFKYGERVSIAALREKAKEVKDENLSFLAEYVFEKIFLNYTTKQWGIGPDEVDPYVLTRVPVVIGKDDTYYPRNKYQGMPNKGYTKMFEKMLDNEHISIMMNTDYKKIISQIEYERLIFTGPIDEYFDYKYGKLEYRKTLYQIETIDVQSYQQTTIINYPNNHPYTRITEMKKFYPESSTFSLPKTVICKEYPGIGDIEAYPVEVAKNKEILEKYKAETKNLKNVYFLGRLANYKYFDMDVTCKTALDFYENNLK